MALNPLSVWKSTFATAIVPTSGNSWAMNLANWAGDQADLMQMTLITGGTFTFNRSTFASELLTNVSPSTNKSLALDKFVDAWETAVLASSMSVSGGTGFGFSAIVGSGIASNTASIKTSLKATLMSGSNSADINDSVFPQAFRSAFASLIFNVTGMGVPPSPPPPIAPFSGSSPVI
jgi:hypothetical protein